MLSSHINQGLALGACLLLISSILCLNSYTPIPDYILIEKLLSSTVFLTSYASTPFSALISVSYRSTYCSSVVPGMQPSTPQWSAQKNWKSKKSVFITAASKKKSRFLTASENEESGLVVFLCTIICSHSAFFLVLADYHCAIPTGSIVSELPVDNKPSTM